MTKVNIITLQNVRNYGSALQAVATAEVFRRNNCKPRFYDYYKNRQDINYFHRAKSYYSDGSGWLVRVVKALLLSPTFHKQDRLFPRFLERYLDTLPGLVSDPSDFENPALLDADIFVTGSDQTWNSGWNNGLLTPLFLDFAPQGKPRIAFAASFGKDRLDAWEIDRTRELLNRYSAISVREKSAVKIIDDLDIGVKAVHILDPTLQVSGEFWRKLLSTPVNEKPYLLLYQLNHNPTFDRFAAELAHRKGLQLIRWCNRFDQMRLPGDKKLMVPTVEEFVSYIDHADFILTDSFHCTAFSLNLNKQFMSVYPDEYSSRLKSLLELTGLENRRASEPFSVDYALSLSPIDYTNVNSIFEDNRAIADKFVKDSITLCKK